MKFAKRICDMKAGEVGYTYPWAIVVDLGMNVYLNTNMIVKDQKIGDHVMYIKKTGNSQDPYDVDPQTVYDPKTKGHARNYEWLPAKDPKSTVDYDENDKIVKIHKIKATDLINGSSGNNFEA